MIAQPELFQLEPKPWPTPTQPEPADETPRATERDMLDLLHRRYSQTAGNGARYACAEHVRNAPSFNANRTADFIAMDTWQSSGLLLHGHEIKVSRADWLRELADPDKAQAFMRYMDRWWLAVPDERIVRNDLPEGWGLLVQRGDRLVVTVAAPTLNPEPLPRTLLAPLMRSTAATAHRQAARDFRRTVTEPERPNT